MSSAAAAPTPPETPGEAGISREEFDELKRRLDEFSQATERIANATTAEEEQRREREAREAAERVERTAERVGLSPADVGEIRGWIRSETKEAVREALEEVAEVRREDGGDEPASTLADLADDPTRKPPAEPAATTPPAEPPAAEEPPKREHWFHRPFGGNEESADGK